MTGPRECYGFSRACFLKINYGGFIIYFFPCHRLWQGLGDWRLDINKFIDNTGDGLYKIY